MKNLNIKLSLLTVLLSAAILSGCASKGVINPGGKLPSTLAPDERGPVAGTGIESQDIVSVTDQMARKIMGVPEIANAATAPRIVLLPVENNTRFPINKSIFLDEIMARLSDNPQTAGKVRFLARDRMADLERERTMKQTGQVTSSTDPNVNKFKGADFFLTGKLDGLTTKTSAGTSDYILYTFTLINPDTSEQIWMGSARIKKAGQEDASYR